MKRDILTRLLAVSHHQGARKREGLMYIQEAFTQASDTRGTAPPLVFVSCMRAILQQDIDRIRVEVEDLNERARVGQKRGNNGIETAASTLARHILPAHGLIGMLGEEVHPQFDIIHDAASAIPWEVLEERYFSCPQCNQVTSPHFPLPTEQPYCSGHGVPMVHAGGKLALTFHLTHLVRGQGHPAGQGKNFLCIVDPSGDLCGRDKDPHGLCENHLGEIHARLVQQGYTVKFFRGRQATVSRVLKALADPSVVGVYYFGHGFFHREGNEGCLILAEGQPLFASQIEEVRPTAGFVFINACYGATTGRDWELEQRYRSVAEAFAGGGPGKVVIAPLWPMINTQAAETALDFFRNASQTAPLGEALRQARQSSLQRYNDGEPHIAWMAYRYFGDPNAALPVPMEEPPNIESAGAAVSISRIFDEHARLNTDIFAFVISQVLFRAGKRRYLQGRRRLTITDLLAGMIRKGDLTRFILRQQGIDPDRLYKKILKWPETEPDVNNPVVTDLSAPDDDENTSGSDTARHADRKRLTKAELRELLSKLIVRKKEEFNDDLVALLDTADRCAQQRSARTADQRISEHDLLEKLIAEPIWEIFIDIGLPSAEEIRNRLLERERSREIDENGALSLSCLQPAARKIVKTAHTQAQQRGMISITNRLMLAAFLTEKKGYAAATCRRVGIDSKLLFTLMIAATKKKSPRSFGLNMEACERIVVPMIKEAMSIATDAHAVTEQELFNAFCRQADPAFKAWLKQPPLKVDLDALGSEIVPHEASDMEENAPPRSGTARQAQSLSASYSSDTEGPSRVSKDASNVSRDQFEDSGWQVLRKSLKLAQEQGWPEVRTPHLFAALIGDDGLGPAGVTLRQNHVNPVEIKQYLLAQMRPQSPFPSGLRTPRLGANAGAVVKRALQMAVSDGRTQATAEDLLTAFFADGGGAVGEYLRSSGVQITPHMHGSGMEHRDPNEGSSVLSALGRNLTAQARSGQLPEVIGRDNEIETAMATLQLTENANPLLVGEAGVGKTAIVEGLAQCIAQRQCPEKLQHMHIIELSAGRLVANTRLRGEFEQRMQEVLHAARENVILFIDEIHTIVGAGMSEGGGLDAGNMLKAALARGEIRLIGATTHAEYTRTIAQDTALARRFQMQVIQPPSFEATLKVLSGHQQTLEQYHGVHIDEEVKAAAVELSGRYIVNKQWPAKARDVLERACVLAATRAEKSPVDGAVTVTPEHVAQVVSRHTGIPLERVSPSDLVSLATLEERLCKRLIGQPHAVRAVADAMRRGRQGLASEHKPWGVFLFAGPSGVGKTELAKALAEEGYGSPDWLVRFDMGDFAEPHAATRLLGAPPGFVGYGQGTPLAGRLRRQPYALLLFDEIEHAHENVLAVLLPLLSEGTLMDADGNIADARNTIVIVTTNVLTSERTIPHVGFTRESKGASTQLTQTELRSLLEQHLPSKLLDRFDAIISFNTLNLEDLKLIVERNITEVVRRVRANYGVEIEVRSDVLPWLAREAASERCGVRAIQTVIDGYVVGPLSGVLGGMQGHPRGSVLVSVVNGAIQVQETDVGA